MVKSNKTARYRFHDLLRHYTQIYKGVCTLLNKTDFFVNDSRRFLLERYFTDSGTTCFYEIG